VRVRTQPVPEQPHGRIPRHRPGHAWLRMGDREAEPAVPRTELEEIASKISDLNKWREIFSFRG